MNCQEFEIIIRDVARDSTGAEIGAARVDTAVDGHQQAVDHAVACGACALRLQDERTLSRALASLVTEMKPLAPDAGVEQELLAAFRQAAMPGRVSGSVGILPASSIYRKSGQDARAPRGSRAVGDRAYWMAAAAAVLLLVVGTFALRALLSRPSESQAGNNIEALNLPQDSRNLTPATDNTSSVKEHAGSVSTEVAASNPNPQTQPRPVRKRLPQPARRPLQPAGDAVLAASAAEPASIGDQADNEVTTQFIALSYLGPASLQDGGQIVRVELPRSAMASFGLPVNMDRFGEKVRADVFVSADGFARAIRFVQ